MKDIDFFKYLKEFPLLMEKYITGRWNLERILNTYIDNRNSNQDVEKRESKYNISYIKTK